MRTLEEAREAAAVRAKTEGRAIAIIQTTFRDGTSEYDTIPADQTPIFPLYPQPGDFQRANQNTTTQGDTAP